MKKIWFVTGASRGIGARIVQSALAVGDAVVATARSIDTLVKAHGNENERLVFARLDVCDPAQMQQAIALATQRLGDIDVLVNNAGFGQLGHFETVEASAIEKQFSTNVFGLMNVTRAVLPAMRRNRRGHILNISSIGGAVGFDGASIYCATKFAVEGFSESLALEVERFGLNVTIVEPGFFRTDFLDTSSVRYGDKEIPDYAEAATEQRTQYDAYSHAQPGDPAKLAHLIVDVAGTNQPPLRLVAGSDALQMSRDLLNNRQKELQTWAARAVSTDYQNPEVHYG